MSELSKISMNGYRLVCGHKVERWAILHTIGLHQVSILNPHIFYFNFGCTHLTHPKYMLFVDDIILLKELGEDFNERMETWRQALEMHDFRLSRSKTGYAKYKFNKMRSVSNLKVKIGDHITP